MTLRSSSREAAAGLSAAGLAAPPRVPFALVLALFFVSGASGLVYEVLWTRRLTLLFGSGLFATSTVLATFMGGLALGAWLLGRVADTQRSPFALYGWLEVAVGAFALALPLLLAAAIPVYQWVYRTWDGAPIPVNGARFLLSAAIFIVPSLMMGGTLPALSRFVVRDESGVGEKVGRLYAINTWGAVAGCSLAGFVLIEFLGLRGAELATAAANFSVGAIAIVLGRRAALRYAAVEVGVEASIAPPGDPPLSVIAPDALTENGPLESGRKALVNGPDSAVPREGDRSSRPTPSPGGASPLVKAVIDAEASLTTAGSAAGTAPQRHTPRRALVLVAMALSGFAALGYEVIWTRYLSFFLGNSTYAFTIMLGTFLVGLAAGAVVAARRVDRIADPYAAFAWIETLVGASMAAGVAVYAHMADVQALIYTLIPSSSWIERVGVRFFVAFVVLVIPTFFLGATFPLAGRIYVSGRARVGADVGRLYAANTLGAILGSVGAGFVLIPALGFRDSVVLLVCVNAALAAGLSIAARRRLPVRLGAAVLAVAAVVALPRKVFLSTIERAFPGEEIVYYRENPSATVFVTRTSDDERWVHFSDQRGSGGTLNLPGHRFWGHLPSVLCERRGSACVICFGSGITLGALARHPFERIVCAEICERIHEPARWFPENHAVLDDPRVRLVTDDGRNVLLGTSQTFDVIVSEPPLLETAGVVNLFTRDFYEVVKARLSPGGVFCQWIPSGEFTRDQHALLIRTFLEVFPNATFWGTPLYYDTVLIGSLEPKRFDLSEIARRVAEPDVRRDLEESGIDGPLELLSYFGLSAEGLQRYCGAGPVMSDNRTVLDFEMPRTVHQLASLRQVTYWKKKLGLSTDLLAMQAGDRIAPLIDWPPEGSDALRARLEAIERAKQLVLAGHRAAEEGHDAEQARLYDEALAAAPGFTTARYYAALNRVERAEAAASAPGANGGDEAVRLAREARQLASGFAHLERRLRGVGKEGS